MDTLELRLAVPSIDQDRIIAWLDDWATGFVQENAELRAYVPSHRWSEDHRQWLEERLSASGYNDVLTVRPLAKKNWNARWEESLTPVRAGPFLLCPSSANAQTKKVEATVIRIDPAMSFGTGHHATTRLALRLLATALHSGDRVLDVGTGTGVLAIASCLHGAASSVGVDTNPDAVMNARENAAQNDVSDCVTVYEGSAEAIPDGTFNLIAANITRQILLDLLPDLVSRLSVNGALILSGILHGDRDQVLDAIAAYDLCLHQEMTEEGWWAASFLSS